MSQVSGQVHDKFKAFSAPLTADGSIGPLAAQVESWVTQARVAPKSVGVEYVESLGRVVLTIGYRDDEAPYRVGLACVPLGKLHGLEPADLARLEAAMSEAGSRAQKVICHEIYVTGTNEFMMVFMTHRSE